MFRDGKIALIIAGVGLAIFCYFFYKGKISGLQTKAMQEVMYAMRKATVAGKTTEEIEWAGRVAGIATLQGISEAEAAERFRVIWARAGYPTPPI